MKIRLILTLIFLTSPKAFAINIVVSIPDFESIVNEIVEANVSVILPAGMDPHTFSITKETIEKIKRADLIILANSNLLSYEKNIKENWDKEYLDFEDYNATLFDFDGFKNNPHGYWMYINNSILIAKAIAYKLAEIYPEKKDYYIKNYENFKERLMKAGRFIINLSKEKGIYGKKVIAAVPGVCYIVKNLGIEADEILFAEGTSITFSKEIWDKEYLGIVVPEFLKDAKAGKVAEQIARDTNTSIIYVKFAEGGDFLNNLYYNSFQFLSFNLQEKAEYNIWLIYLSILLIILAIVEGIIIYMLYRRW